MTEAPAKGWFRRRWPLLAAGAVLLAAGWAAAWFAATAQLEAGVATVLDTARAQGWTIVSDSPARAATPWSTTVQLPHVTATRLLGGQPLRWTAELVEVSLSPLDPTAVHIDASGAQSLALGPQLLPYGARRASLRIPLVGDTARLVAEGIETRSGPTALTVASLVVDLAPLAIAVGGDGVAMSPPLPAPFDGPAAFSVRIVDTVPFPLDEPGAASAWRKAGGRLEMPGLVLRWGPLDASGEAVATLDDALQPNGRGTLRVRGATNVLDAAARAGLIAPSPAQAARAVLGLLAMAAQGGPLTLPVTLRDRTLSVAQFPLARLPMLDWDHR